MVNKVLQDWTLSDGTLIPAGTIVAVANDAMHKDEVRAVAFRELIDYMCKIGVFSGRTYFQGIQILRNAGRW